MYSDRRKNLTDRADGAGGLARRRPLQGAGALGLAAILRPTTVFAEREDNDERLGAFGPWSTPVNLGPVVNTQYLESHPAISKKLRCRSELILRGQSGNWLLYVRRLTQTMSQKSPLLANQVRRFAARAHTLNRLGVTDHG